MPAARQNRSKLADTSSQALTTAPIFVEGNTVGVVLILFMALLSFRGISTPSLSAQGEQRCFSYFNIERDNSKPFGSQPYRGRSHISQLHGGKPHRGKPHWSAAGLCQPHKCLRNGREPHKSDRNEG